jgi:hypothetical protein
MGKRIKILMLAAALAMGSFPMTTSAGDNQTLSLEERRAVEEKRILSYEVAVYTTDELREMAEAAQKGETIELGSQAKNERSIYGRTTPSSRRASARSRRSTRSKGRPPVRTKEIPTPT